MSTYAEGTKVTVFRSRLELEQLLVKHKATHVNVGFAPGRAVVQFVMQDRMVRFQMALATAESLRGEKDRRGWLLSEAQRLRLAEQRNREQWRALVLAIKAKLVSVETGVESFEVAFLAHIVVGKETVGERVLPAVAHAYASGGPLLLGPGEGQGHG